MNDVPWGTIIAAILAFIGGGGGVFILSLLRQTKEEARKDKQQDNDLRLSETEKAFTIYKEIVSSLKKDIEQHFITMQALEKNNLDTREAKAILQGKLELAENKLTYLQKEYDSIIKELEGFKKKT